MKSLAIYIHVPFCIRKCYYCDFLSFPEMGSEMQRRYFQVLLKEIDEACAALPKQSADVYEVSSIYFGGGTPSYPDEKLIENVINHIHDHFQVRMDAEITIPEVCQSFILTRLEGGRTPMPPREFIPLKMPVTPGAA